MVAMGERLPPYNETEDFGALQRPKPGLSTAPSTPCPSATNLSPVKMISGELDEEDAGNSSSGSVGSSSSGGGSSTGGGGGRSGSMSRPRSKSPQTQLIRVQRSSSSAFIPAFASIERSESEPPLLRSAFDKCVSLKAAPKDSVLASRRSGSPLPGVDDCLKLTMHFDALPRSMQLLCLACGVFVFFGASNFLQESLIHMEGFRPYAWALGLFEMTGIFASTALERKVLGETERRASRRTYTLLTLCLASSSTLSTISLRYINYPLKVVGRSCKLLPTLGAAVLWNRRPLRVREVAAAAAVSAGLVAFALGDMSASPDFDVRGILLVMLSVCADALLPNLQELAFEEGASRSEVMFYSNMCTMFAMSFTVGLSGGLGGAVAYLFSHPLALSYIMAVTIVAYFAIFCHMHLVKRFGGVTTVFVGSARKACTVSLSFLFFDNHFTSLHLLAGLLVLSGLVCSSLSEVREPKSGHCRRSGAEKKKADAASAPEISDEEAPMMMSSDSRAVSSSSLSNLSSARAKAGLSPNPSSRRWAEGREQLS